MTSPTGSRPTRVGSRPTARRHAAFTLIELILVMAILVIGFGAAFPTLRRFFSGRTLDSEARRIQALARFGQNRAISEGVPMVLWIDQDQRRYGLEAAAGFADPDAKAIEFTADDDITLEVGERARSSTVGTFSSGNTFGSSMPTPAPTVRISSINGRSLAGFPAIRLLPDGYVGVDSPESIELRQDAETALWLVQSTNRLGYELRTEPPAHRR